MMMKELIRRKKGSEPSEERLDNFAEAFFGGADTDHDGKVNREEFYAYYKAK